MTDDPRVQHGDPRHPPLTWRGSLASWVLAAWCFGVGVGRKPGHGVPG